MLIKDNFSLSELSTIRIGGTALRVFYPENVDELLDLLDRYPTLRYRVISNGSNLLINDHIKFNNILILCMRRFCHEIMPLDDEGLFYIGAGANIGKIIMEINTRGFGGIEPLISIPGLLGGLVCMNASVPSASVSISDYLVSVDVVRELQLQRVPRRMCGFGYRKSVFQGSGDVICGATFRFPRKQIEKAKQDIRDRVLSCKAAQDRSGPNFGTVFSVSNGKIMRAVKILGLGVGGCHYSRKTANWLINRGGTYSDVVRLIRIVERIHAVFGLPCKREVVIWDENK